MPTIDLTDEQLAAVIRALRRAIYEDRHPLSDRVRTWKSALVALEPSSAPELPGRPEPPLPPVARSHGVWRRRR